VRGDGETVRGGRVTNLPLAAGDLVRVVTGNGGGWGDPHERERDLILEDVRDEYVTPEVAREVYGADVDLSANRECV
jgi:N-methylhydantoinase B